MNENFGHGSLQYHFTLYTSDLELLRSHVLVVHVRIRMRVSFSFQLVLNHPILGYPCATHTRSHVCYFLSVYLHGLLAKGCSTNIMDKLPILFVSGSTQSFFEHTSSFHDWIIVSPYESIVF